MSPRQILYAWEVEQEAERERLVLLATAVRIAGADEKGWTAAMEALGA